MAKKKQADTRGKKAVIKNTGAAAGKSWKILAFVFACGFLLYANTFGNFYSLDDDIYTQKNAYVQEGITSNSIKNTFCKGTLYGFNKENDANYRPLTQLNFIVDTAMWGNNPYAEHVVNTLLYAITGVLVYLLLLKFFRNYHYVFSLLIALVFIFHPVHTDVVASIKSRDEILGWFFGVISFIYLMRFAESGGESKKFLALTALFYFLATLCKENSLTFLLLYPLALFIFSDLPLKKIFITTIPFAAVAALNIFIRWSVLDTLTFKDKMIVMNNSLVAAKTLPDRYATNFVIMGKYLWLLFFPITLSWDYSYNEIPVVSPGDPVALLSLAAYLAIGVFALIRLKNKDALSFSIFFFLVTIFLASNLLVMIGATMAERFLYVPSFGFSIALVVIIFKLLKINPEKNILVSKPALFSITGIILLLFAVKTFTRNQDWQSSYSLFSSGVETSPHSARTHFAIAGECRTQGELQADPQQKINFFKRSISEYRIGRTIFPGDAELWYNIGVVNYDLAGAYDMLKKPGSKIYYDSALICYDTAVKMLPAYPTAWNNAGVIWFNKGKFQQAIQYFRQSIKYDSTYADATGNLGAAYLNLGRNDSALVFLQKSLKLNPSNVGMEKNIAMLYGRMGDKSDSAFYANKISQNAPANSSAPPPDNDFALIFKLFILGLVLIAAGLFFGLDHIRIPLEK